MRYTVEHRTGTGPIWSATHDDKLDALDQLEAALMEDGHRDEVIDRAVGAAFRLQDGGAENEFRQLTPDLRATTLFRINK